MKELTTMKKEARERYDQRRSFEQKAFRSLCYAPFASLYFENTGDVRVCCHNWKYAVGNVLHKSIDEMWSGARITVLRDYLKDYRFGPGCDLCYFQAAEGNYDNLAINRFEPFEAPTDAPEWPQQMEFSMSNSCNLECIMCSGNFSSSIRAHREKLPPMPRIYSDEILDSLRKYLPHLKVAKFLGGEPFLVTEYHRIWDMMVEDGLQVLCHVTTNGTQYNQRVERILNRVPVAFAVSLDGATRETVEGIRVNAKYEEVMENARRFRNYARAKGTSFTLTFCLMRQNWHEFADYCLMADQWDCDVYVNLVVNPPQFGIYTLPIDELRKILAAMEARVPQLEPVLRRNRSVWFGELDRIRAKCRENSSRPPQLQAVS